MKTRIAGTVQWIRVVAAAIGAGLLTASLPAVGKAVSDFEFSSVVSSSADVPALLADESAPEDSRTIQICDELSKGRSLSRVAKHVQLEPAQLQARVAALAEAGLLRRDSANAYTPTFPIVRQKDAKWLVDIDRPIIDATARAIEARQQDLRKRFETMLELSEDQARDLSLILFGDVLFDRWQTRHLRTGFLPGPPPTRGGKVFNLVALEKRPGEIGSLGIYTHSEPRYGDTTVITYGNKNVMAPFGDDEPQAVLQPLKSYLAFVRGTSPPDPQLEHLGVIRAGRPAIITITQDSYSKLPEITNSFTDELLNLLKADRAKLLAAYTGSHYARGVSFQEFALWWYHFFNAAVIQRLIEDGVITVPSAGYATMIVTPS